MELTVFIATALAMCLKDIADIKRSGQARATPAYIAAVSAAVALGAALIPGRGTPSVIGAITAIFS
ncbi:MAG: hypothetical protein LBC21_00385 [Oscillospiraceae bacterium]|jgi:hypothetical protein|nr:hypothetical protein [Oscillospiraceae bacterium]